MDDEAVEAVRDRRAGRAAGGVVGSEHEVIHEKLRPATEEIHQRRTPVVGLESILLVEPYPWELLAPLRQLVAAACELFLRLEQLESRSQPLLTGPGLVLRHGYCSPYFSVAESGRSRTLHCLTK